MKQEVLGNFDLPWIPVSAMILFVLCFAIFCYWTFKRSNRGLYQEAAAMPLEDAHPHRIRSGESHE